jgi:hypothetical protein
VTRETTSHPRGNERLLWDYVTIGRLLDVDRPPARARLEAKLGTEFTRLLLATLRESEPATLHEYRLRCAARDDVA